MDIRMELFCITYICDIIHPMHINWEISDSDRLSYELVTVTNYHKILSIFVEDEPPFVSDSYKDPKKLKEYFENMEKLRESKSKFAGQEWLLYHQAEQKYIGIISLYDLSSETFNHNNQRCTLGFAINAPYRKQGYGSEAVKSIIRYSKNTLGRHLILAYTHDTNPASKRLLTNLGFQDVTHLFICGPDIRYFSLED